MPRLPGAMRRSPAGAFLLVFAAFLACLAAPARGEVFAVDLGSSSMKISLVRSAMPPVSIVTNELSRRKTPTAVALGPGGVRLVGEEAAASWARAPEFAVARPLALLGRAHDAPEVVALQRQGLLPPDVVPAPGRQGAAAVRFPGGEVLTAEELVASVIEHARDLATEAAGGSKPVAGAFVLPPDASPAARAALVDAASLAGVRALALPCGGAVASVQWGLDRAPTSKDEKPIVIVFYDVGSSRAEASVVAFRPGASPSAPPVADVFTAAAEEGTGTDALENALVDLVSSRHAERTGFDPRQVPRARARVRAACARALRVLSANADARISVEDVKSGDDLRDTVTRDELEAQAAGPLARGPRAALAALASAGVGPEHIDAVELLGGGSRVPAVRKALEAAFAVVLEEHKAADAAGGKLADAYRQPPLERRLDADEAMALGAGLLAANRSAAFRVRRIALQERTTFRLEYELRDGATGRRVLPPTALSAASAADDEAAEGTAAAKDPAAGAAAAAAGSLEAHPRHLLLKEGKRLPARRGVPLPIADASETLDLTLFWRPIALEGEAAAPQPEPLGTWRVSGLAAGIAEHDNVTRSTVHVLVDLDGLVHVESADLTYWEPVAPQTDAEPTNATKADADAGAGAKLRRGRQRLPLALASAPFARASKDDLARQSVHLDQLRARERARRETEQARDALERYAIDLLGWVEAEDEDALAATTAEEREAAAKAARDVEDWLIFGDEDLDEDAPAPGDDDENERVDAVGASEPAETPETPDGIAFSSTVETVKPVESGPGSLADGYRARLTALRRVGEPLRERAVDHRLRPDAIERAQATAAEAAQLPARWRESKPWLPGGDVRDLERRGKALADWLEEKLAEQAKRSPQEPPAFTAHEAEMRQRTVRRLIDDLEAIPEPAKPKAEENSVKEEDAAAEKKGSWWSRSKAKADDEPKDKAEGETDAHAEDKAAQGSSVDDIHSQMPADGTPIPPHDELKKARQRLYKDEL